MYRFSIPLVNVGLDAFTVYSSPPELQLSTWPALLFSLFIGIQVKSGMYITEISTSCLSGLLQIYMFCKLYLRKLQVYFEVN